MNCFEARREFRSFWRRELTPELRETFVAHLRECAGCDSAFRNFALSAPALHSDVAPERCADDPPRPRVALSARRPPAAYRGAPPRRVWMSMSAAVAVLMAGALAAYLSVSEPVGNLGDVLSQSEPEPVPVVELFVTQTQSQDNGLAG